MMAPRECIECGKWHDAVIQSIEIEEIIEELQLCKDCLFKNCFYPITGKIHIQADNINEQHLADQMATMYNHLASSLSITDKSQSKVTD